MAILCTEPDVRTEKREEQEKKEEPETTKGKEAPADKGKKLRRGRLIFKKEGTKGVIEAGNIVWCG